MGLRIKYEVVSEHKLKSINNYAHPTEGALYRIEIDKTEPQWLVIEIGCGLVAASGRHVSLRVMQRHAKNALKKLGVLFQQETRKK